MSDYISKCDWFKHLHVQVALWEKGSVNASTLHGCKCKKKSIHDIKHCLIRRLSLCRGEHLVPKAYAREVDAFFEFLKHPKYTSKRITNLVKERDCAISLFKCLGMFHDLDESEKKRAILKFDSGNIPTLLHTVRALLNVLRCSRDIQHVMQPERIGRRQPEFNVTTWMRHMYRKILQDVNNIQGRVRWHDVHNGHDPNNIHTNPSTGLKQDFTARADLIMELKSLLSLCSNIPRPYKEEIHLLKVFLEGGVLDKKKVQEEVILRKTVVGLQEILHTLHNSRNSWNYVILNIEPSRIGYLVEELVGLQTKLEVRVTVTRERTGSISLDHRHDESVESVDLDALSGEGTVDVIAEQHTSYESSGVEIDITNDVGIMAEAEMIDETPLTVEERVLADSDCVTMSPDHDDCSDLWRDSDSLNRELMPDMLLSNILDQSFRQLPEDAEKIISMPFILSGEDNQEDDGSLEGHTSEKIISCLGQSTNTFTRTTADSIPCGNAETATAISTDDKAETDRDHILDVWSGLGSDFIKTANTTELLKMRARAADICKQIRVAELQGNH